MKTIELSNCDEKLILDDEDFIPFARFTWRAHKSHGDHKYVVRGKAGIYVHNELMGPIPEGFIVDHINGNGFDNRKENLRIIPKEKNTWNRKAYKDRKYKGTAKISGAVEGHKQYQARIRYEGQLIYIGSYYTEEEAARAYDNKAKELFGELACLNF